VQKTQDLFCNPLEASDRAGFQRMNDYSIFCSCKGTEFYVNIFLLLFFASFVYPVAPEDGTGASLRETFLVPACPG